MYELDVPTWPTRPSDNALGRHVQYSVTRLVTGFAHQPGHVRLPKNYF